MLKVNPHTKKRHFKTHPVPKVFYDGGVNFKKLKIEAKKEIKKVKDLKGLDEVFNKYLGKKGELTRLLKSLEKLPKSKRVEIGREANKLKDTLSVKFYQKAQSIKEKIGESAEGAEWFDITIPAKKPPLGHLHPLTKIKREIEGIFERMGFSIVEGPEIETEWYNFDALNIPKEHPARDFWDTLFLKIQDTKAKKLLLRTHTSPVQVRYLEKNNPPLRIIVPGRVFRHEATDARHEINFHQSEGLMIGKDISVANFRAIIEEFFKRYFGEKIKIRLRSSYFPFTEPSFEIDLLCLNCGGKGCSICGQSGWLEMMGAGMVHPNVFKNAGLNPKFLQGFAFGMGIERLAMMKYKINDIRLFYSGDLRFLNQF